MVQIVKILKNREEGGEVTGKGGIAPGPHGAKVPYQTDKASNLQLK